MERHFKQNRRKYIQGDILMISSKEFRELSLHEQSELTKSDLSDWEIWTYDNLRITNEDLSNKATHSKLKELSIFSHRKIVKELNSQK